jgi:GNAT superfamily N-acetyltransferase
MNKQDFVVVPYDPTLHKSALLQFLSYVYRPDAMNRRERVLDWIQNEHPYRDRTPLRFVIMDGDRMAATLGHLPADFLVNGQRIPSRFTHDLLVDPTYRGQGLATKIVGNAFFRDEFLPGGMWMTGPCHKIHLSSGFDDAHPLVPRTLVLDPGSFTERKNFSGLKRLLAKPVLQLIRARAIARARNLTAPDKTPFRSRFSEQFPAELDETWLRMLGGYGVSMMRESGYLNWRYARHPVLDYRICLAEREGQVAGYMVWRMAPDHEDEKRAVITDFLVEKGDAGALKYLLSFPILEAAETGMEALSVLTTQRWATGMCRKFGFLPRGNAHAWVIGGWKGHFSSDWVTNPEPWHMCMGDSDGDMWTGSV